MSLQKAVVKLMSNKRSAYKIYLMGEGKEYKLFSNSKIQFPIWLLIWRTNS